MHRSIKIRQDSFRRLTGVLRSLSSLSARSESLGRVGAIAHGEPSRHEREHSQLSAGVGMLCSRFGDARKIRVSKVS
jgi:hypothetical protein